MKSPSPQLLRALRTSLSHTRRTNLSGFSTQTCAIPASTAIPKRNISTSAARGAMRMESRAHTHRPATHDRGPESQESTQTDFGALNVLGNIPAPTTSVDACLDSGFHLNNGVKVSGGDGVLLVGGEAFAWRPWMAKEGAENNLAARDSMLNAKGQIELDESVWGVLNLVWPKPDMLILGLGGSMFPLSPETRRHINSLGIRVDILDTRNAAAQFNLLATERGLTEIAAAMIPIGWKARPL